MKEKLDYIFNKMLPKKFIIITIATVVVFMELNPPQEYWWLLIAYFTGNAVQKFTKKGALMNVKKILVIAGIAICIITASFLCGRQSILRRFKDMEKRITESTRDANKYATELEIVSRELGELTRKNRRLIEEINSASIENGKLTDRLKTTAKGLPESIEGLSGVIKGIDFYIKQTENQN